MTRRRAFEKAKQMPTIENGTYTLLSSNKHTIVSFPNTFRMEAIAREETHEVFISALMVGVILTSEEINLQEKWERILQII